MRRVVLLLLAPIFIAACAGATTQSAGSGSRTDLGAPAPAVDAVKSGSAAAGSAVQQGIPNPIVVNPDRSVILTANIALRAKDPWATSDRAQAIATGLGGDVRMLNQSWDPAKTFTRALAALGTMLRVFADFGIWLLVFGWIPLLALALVLVATRVRSRPATPVA